MASEHCDKCGTETPGDELHDMQVCRQTMSSPAEYEQWCERCCGRDVDDHDAWWGRALINDPDMRDCS